MGLFGVVSIWSWVPLSLGCPLNLVLYMPFRIFAYSSNILKANFDLMDSMPACGTLKKARLSCRSCSFRDLAPAMKLLLLTNHPWGPSVSSSADFIDAYWATAIFLARMTY